jgi:hypothetical protein
MGLPIQNWPQLVPQAAVHALGNPTSNSLSGLSRLSYVSDPKTQVARWKDIQSKAMRMLRAETTSTRSPSCWPLTHPRGL